MIRVGQGWDVHAFDAKRRLVLGGVLIPASPGLAGHSDADVVLHAITDALLGAIGAGDIGEHFPSNDSRWKDADSSAFVREALRLVYERKASITNLDVTILAETPRLAEHKDAIRQSVADLLDVHKELVNIKATTTDHLGFIGREEGIAATAIVALELHS
ncbi:MAG TPA: 2-C-methyl-D-erythritol 2,4-cyclodiphosphate synthase [Thermoanaerobaculia bacterium]|nr:2-C-methyl-D-erythritol 2,4-cyclodiphosphate synthase [Thermoanaerobaculia bacterium]